MTMPGVQVTCNWNQIGGCELAQSIRCKVNQKEVFTPPHLDSILETENAVLLKQHDIKEPCEFRIQLQQSPYKIESISIVSTVQKLELFLGPQNEYTNVYQAEELEDIDEGAVFTFRHDIEIKKKNITEVMLKMLLSSDEICIFGAIIQIARNQPYVDISKLWWNKSAKSTLDVPEDLHKNEVNLLFEKRMKSLREKTCNSQAQSTLSIDLANEYHENPTVQVACNWKRSGGCEFSQNVHYEITHEYYYIPPELNTIVEKNNAIFLKHDDNVREPCEVHFKLLPAIYKVESISLVSTVSKLEVFLGPLNEYSDTFYSNALEDKSMDIAFTYRHDIQVNRSGITEIMIKLISPSDEICIFGTVLQIAPNPNGITTGSNFDLAKLLSKSDNFPRKEACLLFLEKMVKKQDLANKNQTNTNETIVASPALDVVLKSYLDNRFEQLERKINERLDNVIAEQNAKLDKILEMLVNKTIV